MTLTITDLNLPDRIVDRINTDGPTPADPARPVAGPCWIWTGGTFAAGYGSVWLDGANRLVHQVVFEAATGTRSDRDQFVDHLCRTRACCSPSHLELVTPAGNMLSAQRDHCQKGHPFDQENTSRPKRRPTQRVCKACSRAKSRAYRARRAGKAAATC